MDTTVFLQLLLPGLTTGCVYALVALGFVLCANVSGVVNFAQGEFVMLGGMAAAWLIGLNVPFVLAIVAATAIGGAVGAAQEFLTLAPVRRQPHFIHRDRCSGRAIRVAQQQGAMLGLAPGQQCRAAVIQQQYHRRRIVELHQLPERQARAARP